MVTLIHIVNLPQVEYVLYDQQTLDPAMEIAHQIVEQQAEIGHNLGAEVKTRVLTGRSPEREILAFVQKEQVDLIILGSNIRSITGRVFFGHRVDVLLSRASCPVAIITAN